MLFFAIICAVLVTYMQEYRDDFVNEVIESLLIGLTLLASVFFLRYKINRIASTRASLKLVSIHIINFIVWMFFGVMAMRFSIQALNESNEDPDNYYENITWLKATFYSNTFSLLQNITAAYMVLFLLYLNFKFT